MVKEQKNTDERKTKDYIIKVKGQKNTYERKITDYIIKVKEYTNERFVKLKG